MNQGFGEFFFHQDLTVFIQIVLLLSTFPLGIQGRNENRSV